MLSSSYCRLVSLVFVEQKQWSYLVRHIMKYKSALLEFLIIREFIGKVKLEIKTVASKSS